MPKNKRVFGDKCYKVFRGFDYICKDCWYGKFNKYNNVIKFIKKSPVDGKFRDFTVVAVYDNSEIVGYIQLIRTCTEFVEYQKANRHFISVCSRCKKVKENDKWMIFEDYFLRLGLTFSHGICPDCLKEIYPDYADEILKKRDL